MTDPLYLEDPSTDADSTDSLSSNEEPPTASENCPPTAAPKHFQSEKFLARYLAEFQASRSRPYNDASVTLEAALKYYRPILGAVDALPQSAPSYDQLNSLLSSTFRHGDRRVGLWAAAERQEDGTLTCAYTGQLIETVECVRKVKADEEHLVPQSWHRGSRAHPGQDMHQIIVVTNTANDSRVNLVFGYDSSDPHPVPVEGGIVTRDCQRKGQHLFLPHRNIGAVCRATLYTVVCYKDTFIRSYFSDERLAWLKQFAASEPVSPWEIHRNNELQRLQGTRNPFVDAPHWALQIDFSGEGVFRLDATKQPRLPKAARSRPRRDIGERRIRKHQRNKEQADDV